MGINVAEAIKKVRGGEHASSVLFEGSDAAIIDFKKSTRLHEMVNDSILIGRAAYGGYKNAYLHTGTRHEKIEESLNHFRRSLMTLENVAAMVKPSGELNDGDPDPTDDDQQPDKLQSKGKTQESLLQEQKKDDEYAKDKDEYGEDDMDFDKEAENVGDEEVPVGEIDPSEMEDEDMGYSFNVKGVEDKEAFMQAVQQLASDHGGVIMNDDEAEESGMSYEEVNYQPVGKEKPLKGGKKPDDEEGDPSGEAGKMVKDVKSSDKKSGSTEYGEGMRKVRKFRLSEGLRYLLNMKTIIPAKKKDD